MKEDGLVGGDVGSYKNCFWDILILFASILSIVINGWPICNVHVFITSVKFKLDNFKSSIAAYKKAVIFKII